MRKAQAKKLPLAPDPRFNDKLVTRFVNNLMWEGKKSVAFDIFYNSLERVAKTTGEEGYEVWKRALQNVTPALGMGIAMGHYTLVFIATGLILTALFLFSSFEKLIDRMNLARNYKIVSEYKEHLLEDYEAKMKACGLRYKMNYQSRKDIFISGTWLVNGKEKDHHRFVEMILHDDTVKEFEF